MRLALTVVLVCAALSACREGPAGRDLVSGGAFELPDSGFTYDARAFVTRDAEPIDTGPFECSGGCANGSVCGCLDRRPRVCGCFPAQGYNEACDPQNQDTCRFPYQCVRGRRVDGLRYLCSDGRENSSCSPVDSVCRTSNGCVCLTTPLGVGCSCKGAASNNPLLCDPNVPATCPGGSCVHITTGGGSTNICSMGMRYEPCAPGDSTCHTTLGCVCPLFEGRAVCQCGEPGTENGEPCDPRVAETCSAPLECTLVPSETPGAVSSQCRGDDRGDGGVDPVACDPMRPFCPQDFGCREIRPGVYRCVPQT